MKASGKVAVVTGGEGSLAHSLRSGLLAEGFDVHAPGRRELDVTDREQIRRFFDALPGINLLICNAGAIEDRLHLQMEEPVWDKILEVNLNGAAICARLAARTMVRQRSGHILFLSSYSGLRGNAGQTAYAAAKAGLVGLTHSLAKELGKRNVRVNCILPGFLETKMTKALADDAKEKIRSQHALGRFNSLEDAAKFIIFLDTMENISGQVFQLDSRISRWC